LFASPTLAIVSQLDASERKTKALYDHMDDINVAMDESENILKSLNDEMKEAEEKKDVAKEDEINENDKEKQEDGEIEDKKDKSPELNKFVDQISVSNVKGW
jgi:phosphopantothenoylcysteine synthetase/decarboxylase